MKRAALGLIALIAASTATIAHAEPKAFIAILNGKQSVALNSTALETRTGAAIGSIVYDPATSDFKFMLTFRGLIPTDITPIENAIPGTRTGADLTGAGLVVAHIHIGGPEFNGLIPFGFVDQNMMDGKNGLPDGVMSDPNPIQMSTDGSVWGSFNLNDMAAKNMGMLRAGAVVDGTGPSADDPDCARCGFTQAILTNNTYLNIHTFNNLNGEIRGQVIAQDCPIRTTLPVEQLLTELDAKLTTIAGTGATVDALKMALMGVRDGVAKSDNRAARTALSQFLGEVIRDPAGNKITAGTVDRLICGATELVSAIPLPQAP